MKQKVTVVVARSDQVTVGGTLESPGASCDGRLQRGHDQDSIRTAVAPVALGWELEGFDSMVLELGSSCVVVMVLLPEEIVISLPSLRQRNRNTAPVLPMDSRGARRYRPRLSAEQ